MKIRKRWICLAGGLVGALSFGYALLQGIDIGTDMVRSRLLDTVGASLYGRTDVASVAGNPIVGYRARDVRVLSGDIESVRVGSLRIRIDPVRAVSGRDPVSAVSASDGFADLSVLVDLYRPSSSDEPPVFPRISVRRTLLDLPSGPVSVDRITIGAIESSKDVASVEGSVSFLGTPISVSGKLRGDGSASLRASSRVASADLDGPLLTGAPFSIVASVPDLSKLLPYLPQGAPSLSGSAGARVRISPSGTDVVSGNIAVAGAKIASVDISRAGAAFAFDGRKISVVSLDATVMGSSFRGTAAMVIADDPKVFLSLRSSGVRIRDWKDLFPEAAFVSGVIDRLTLGVSGTLRALRGMVALQAARLSVAGFAVKNIRGHVEITPSGYDANILGTVAGTELRVTGKPGKTGDAPRIEVRSDRIDLAALASDTPELSGLGLSGIARGAVTIEGRSIRGSLSGTGLRIADIPVDSAAVSVAGTTTNLALDPISLASEGSSVSGKGSVRIRDGVPLLSIAGSGNLQPKTLARLLPELPLSGPLALSWMVEGNADRPVVTLDAQGKNLLISRKIPVSALSAGGRYENGTVTLAGTGAALLGGTVAVQGTIHLNGTRSRIALSAAMRNLSLASLRRALDLSVPLEGQAEGTLSVEGSIESPVARGEFGASGSVANHPAKLRVSVETKDGTIAFPSVSLSVLSADFSGRGRIALSAPKKPATVSLTATASKIDLRTLATATGIDLPLFGTVVAELGVTGRLDSPAFALVLTSPELRVYGLDLADVTVTLRPAKADKPEAGIAILVKAVLGGRPVRLRGTIVPKSDGTFVRLATDGTSLDLAGLAEAIGPDRKGTMSGLVTFSTEGTIRDDGYRGTGKIEGNRAILSGFEVRDFSLPFVVSDDRVSIAKGTASVYGGAAKTDAEYRIAQGAWTCTLSVTSMDLDRVSRPLLAAPGRIEGNADLKMKASGTAGRFLFVFGDGSFSARNGVISGFPALKKLSDTGTLRFNSLFSSFNIDGKRLYLLPGSRAAAWPGDPVYRYFGVTGNVGLGTSDPFDLKCMGEINVRALNTFLGALQGLLSIEGTLTNAAFLQNFLSGLIGGLSTRDFRETSFSLRGTWAKPELSDFKVTREAKRTPDVPWTTPAKPSTGNGRDFTIRIDIPTGKGADSTPGAEDQVKKQILENLMKSIVTTGESN
jgi:translocation and assembly module TamB